MCAKRFWKIFDVTKASDRIWNMLGSVHCYFAPSRRFRVNVVDWFNSGDLKSGLLGNNKMS